MVPGEELELMEGEAKHWPEGEPKRPQEVEAKHPPQKAAGPEPKGAEGQVKTLKCTECGTMNLPTEWYCEKCGAELSTF